MLARPSRKLLNELKACSYCATQSSTLAVASSSHARYCRLQYESSSATEMRPSPFASRSANTRATRRSSRGAVATRAKPSKSSAC
eukprot:5791677-Prymnesium_polylepis.1